MLGSDIASLETSMDVVIVGAGPAGAWTAYRLARGGARVALVDNSHPREKPCGGGVTGRALALVADALNGAPLASTRIASARFLDTRGGRAAVVPLAATASDEADLVVCSRTTFDARLLEAALGAGATLVRARALDVEAAPSGVRVRTTKGALNAAYVVGADGANSLVRRRVWSPFARPQLSIATGYFARRATSTEIVIELVSDPPGYLWSFPRPDHLAIGVCAPADGNATSAMLRDRAAAWIDAVGLAPGAALDAYAWPIPSLAPRDFERLECAGSRWCLVGDAAGLVDPITREGIFYALRSADLAAAALAGARPSSSYEDAVRAEIAGELARAAAIKDRFFQSRFADLMVLALASSAAVRRVAADLIAGRQPYKGLAWRLARTFELALAWRWLRS